MIEALFILFIGGTALLVWLVARVQSQAAPADPAAELDRLEQYVAWLEDRCRHAEMQNYDDQMKARLMAELWQATEQLDALREQLVRPATAVPQQS